MDPGRRSSPLKFSTRSQRVTGQKFHRAHPPSAFGLQFQNPQRAFAAADKDSALVRRQNLSCIPALFHDFRLPEFQQPGLEFTL